LALPFLERWKFWTECPMNLLCPHCQKMVTVPDQNAGQSMNCPDCGKAFQVPVLPRAPAQQSVPSELPADIPLSPLPPSPQLQTAPMPENEGGATYNVIVEPPRPSTSPPPSRREQVASSASGKPSAQQLGTPPPPPPADYQKHHVFQLRPNILPWVTAVSLGLIFLLWFFPWVGAYPGGYAVYTQNAFQIMVGTHSTDPVGEKVLKEEEGLRENVSAKLLLLLLYFPAALVALALAVAGLVFGTDQSRLLPALQQIWPYRLAISGALAALALFLLFLHAWLGFGLEDAAAKVADAKLAQKRSAATTPEENKKVEIERGRILGEFELERTFWYRLAFLCHLVAIIAVGLQIWLERRPGQPLPQLQVQW
jgi:hypothetical protein